MKKNYELYKRYLNEDLGIRRLAREENINHSLLNKDENGHNLKSIQVINLWPYTQTKKLSEIDKLRLIISKQTIEIVDDLKDKYTITFLSKLININRSGYYKWRARKRKKNQYETNRDLLTDIINEAYEEHKSFGYHRLANFIRNHTGWIVSDNLVHKCCKFANIKSKAKNGIYTNVVVGNWNARKPLEIVVSDMTRIRQNNILYEWTYVKGTKRPIVLHTRSGVDLFL